MGPVKSHSNCFILTVRGLRPWSLHFTAWGRERNRDKYYMEERGERVRMEERG
jgi:hypothetical protein